MVFDEVATRGLGAGGAEEEGGREGGGGLDGEGARFDGGARLGGGGEPAEDELDLGFDLGEFGFGLVVVDGCGEGDA